MWCGTYWSSATYTQRDTRVINIVLLRVAHNTTGRGIVMDYPIPVPSSVTLVSAGLVFVVRTNRQTDKHTEAHTDADDSLILTRLPSAWVISFFINSYRGISHWRIIYMSLSRLIDELLLLLLSSFLFFVEISHSEWESECKCLTCNQKLTESQFSLLHEPN